MIQRILTTQTPDQLFDFFNRYRRKLLNHEWLTRVIAPQCRNIKRGWDGGVLQLMQDPAEFAHFLILLARHEVRSYAEIGVYRGGSLYLVDSYLRAAVAGFSHSAGIDAVDRRLNWSEYSARFPQTEFLLTDSTKLDLTGRWFDAVMVDGGHIERLVLNDYEKVRNHCRLIAFHDIASKKLGVARAWATIQTQHRNCRRWHFITITPKVRWMKGIGVLRLEQTNPNAKP